MATYVYETRRTELRDRLEMIEDGWAYCDEHNEPRVIPQAYYDTLKAEYDALVAADAPTGSSTVGTPDNPVALHRRRPGGSAHANQYGPCTVRYASAAQTRYIKSLLERKDLTGLATAGSELFNLAEIVRQVQQGTVNLRAASAIIDTLLAQPDREVAPGELRESDLATDKQMAFMRKLADEKGQTLPEGRPTRKVASTWIDRLLALPKPVVATAEVTRDDAGVWVAADGTMFRVYFGQQSGKMLMKKAVGGELVYIGRANLAGLRRATAEEAGAWGKVTGTCMICERKLDDPESVDRGIGPVCYAKFGG